jgi:hypothetical protein
MTPSAKSAWSAFLAQKAAWIRDPSKPFPAASNEITTEQVDAMMREWKQRGRGK